MKKFYERIRLFFPGKAFYILIANIVLLFLVSLLDLVGVAAILPIIQVATGADFTTGYLGSIHRILGNPGRNEMVIYTSLILVIAFVFKGVFSLLIKWWSGGFLAKQQAASSVTLLEAYMNDSYLNHRNRSTAEILRTTNDANAHVYSAFIGGLLAVIGEGATILMLMCMLLVIMPMQAGIAFLYFGISAFLLQHFLKNKNREAGAKSLEMSWVASHATLSAIDGFRENRIMGMAPRKIYDFQEARLKAVDAERRRTFYQDLPKYLLEMIFIVGIALILALMVSTTGLESAAYLIVFAGACVRILPSFVRMVASLGVMRAGLPAVELFDRELKTMTSRNVGFIDAEPEVGEFAQINPAIKKINLTVEDLSFRYPTGSTDVLSHLNFTEPAGSSLAIVGGSGSGKTTLIDILLGLIEPKSGKVFFNNQEVHQHLREWHSRVGYVPQDVFLSGRTVREEIAYGLRPEEIDDERIAECIQIAELQDVVANLEDGLDTVIGERGTRLSGGQRQRLGIARSIYRNPSVLVLDEATSALDNETEHKITLAINKLAKEITVIIVAHRLSTVRDVDQLIFMSAGSIVSQGTFEEVRRENSEFAHLVELGQLPG